MAHVQEQINLEKEKRLTAEASRKVEPAQESKTINTTIVQSSPDKGAEELKARMDQMEAKHKAELDAAKALREKLQSDMEAQKAKADAEKKAESVKRKPIRLPGQVRIEEKPATATVTSAPNDSPQYSPRDRETIERARRGGTGRVGGYITTDPYR